MILKTINNIYETTNGIKIKFHPHTANILGIEVLGDFKIIDNSTIIIDDLRINIGDSIEVTLNTKTNAKTGIKTELKTNYKCNYIFNIEIIGNDDFVISESVLNKTTIYATPCLGFDKQYFHIEDRLINTYISHDCKYLYLKYRYFNSDNFKKFDEKLLKHPLLVKDLSEERYFITYKFKIPIKYQKDIDLILKGKFSKMSEGLKKQILKFYDTTEESTIGGVIYKTAKRKKELEDFIDITIPDDIDLDDMPNLQLELWKDF